MESVNCSKCGQQIPESAAFCPYCGTTVPKDAYCPECGSKVPAGSRFCPQCGKCLYQEYPLGSFCAKDKTMAGIFAILLGSLGIHYFYLGKITAGILTIILSCCTCGIWSLLMFIQGIMMLVMSETEFREKYVDTDRTLPLF